MRTWQQDGPQRARLPMLVAVAVVVTALAAAPGAAVASPAQPPPHRRQALPLLSLSAHTHNRVLRAEALASRPWLALAARPPRAGALRSMLRRHGLDAGALRRPPRGNALVGEITSAGPPDVQIGGLDCPTRGDCAAFGTYADALGDPQSALWDETAGEWARGIEVRAPANALSPAVSLATITGVSCPAAGSCVAVGEYLDRDGNLDGMLLSRRGGAWSAATEAQMPSNRFAATHLAPDAPAGQTLLTGVACASSTVCTAVGYYLARNGSAVAVELHYLNGHWGGAQVLAPPSGDPNPSTNPYVLDALTAVDCVAGGSCTAVGSASDANDSLQGWAVTGTGTGTTISADTQLPLPSAGDVPDPNDPQVEPTSVSCPSAGDCAVVGTYSPAYREPGGRLESSGQLEPLALSERAGSWTAIEATLPAGAQPLSNPNGGAVAQESALLSVDCPATGSCSGDGFYVAANSTIVAGVELSMVAGSWQAGRELPLPTSLPPLGMALPGQISCAFTGECNVLASYATPPGNNEPLLGVETGGSWVGSQPVSLPANAGQVQDNATIAGISCPPVGSAGEAADCTLADDYVDRSGNGEAFATSENGHWGNPVALSVPGPSTAELALSLTAVLLPHGARAKIGRILKANGYAFAYAAVEAGRLTVNWRARYRGAKRTIAAGSIHATGPRNYRLKLALTRNGRRLLQRARRVRVTAAVAFAPRAGARLSGSVAFTLHK